MTDIRASVVFILLGSLALLLISVFEIVGRRRVALWYRDILSIYPKWLLFWVLDRQGEISVRKCELLSVVMGCGGILISLWPVWVYLAYYL